MGLCSNFHQSRQLFKDLQLVGASQVPDSRKIQRDYLKLRGPPRMALGPSYSPVVVDAIPSQERAIVVAIERDRKLPSLDGKTAGHFQHRSVARNLVKPAINVQY